MSENKTYDQRVREITKKMAKVYNPGSWLGEDEFLLKIYEPSARIAVDLMAEEVQFAMNPAWSKSEKTQYLLLRGLIPTPERKEAGEV
ncbi:hypothetical protein [Chitinophaga sp. YIM B06452]|uniref:hypothetical protein n=1 Tax=Chitinophaga sp. YIM B06452 TaxID=3082158 RepID=UPI0031FEB278